MADKSFGSFGTFKFDYLERWKKMSINEPIDITNVSHGTQKDVEYFQKNLNKQFNKQIVNYTWEKPSEESPSIYTHNQLRTNHPQHSLELMATYHGYPHVIKQPKWETDPVGPPVLRDTPQKRRTAVLSTMTQYVEEMNKAFPGGK